MAHLTLQVLSSHPEKDIAIKTSHHSVLYMSANMRLPSRTKGVEHDCRSALLANQHGGYDRRAQSRSTDPEAKTDESFYSHLDQISDRCVLHHVRQAFIANLSMSLLR